MYCDVEGLNQAAAADLDCTSGPQISEIEIVKSLPSAIFMVLETWGTVPHTSAEKKIEIEAKSKKLSTFSSFHNTSDLAGYLYGEKL